MLMQPRITLFALLLSVVFCTQLKAQDPRFSQFYAAPLELNPAMIGVYEGKFRATANYRELYTSILSDNPFRTIAASFDMRFNVAKGDYVGVGVSALRDEVGISNYNRVRGNIGASYLKQLGGGRYATNTQYLVAGAQVGVGQRGFDFGKLWFTNQFDTEQAVIDFGASTGENFDNQNTDTYLDFNAGLLWYIVFEENRSIYFGAAAYHLNNPNISFLNDSDEILHTRYVAHAGGELPFNDNLSILPAIAIMTQNQSMSTTLGANFRYRNRDWREVAIRIGGWVHIVNQLDSGVGMDAFIIAAILETEKVNFGINYDITASSLSTANNARGAFELSVVFKQPEKSRYKAACPKF